MNQEDILKAVEAKFTESKNNIDAVKSEFKTTEELVKSQASVIEELKTEVATLKHKATNEVVDKSKEVKTEVDKFFKEAIKAINEANTTKGKQGVEVAITPEVLKSITQSSFTPWADWGTTVTLPGIEAPLSDNTLFNILDYLPVGQTNAVHLKKIKRGARIGTAQFINPCTLKPLIQQTWEKLSLDPVKIAGRTRVCDEILEDVPEARAEILEMLREALKYGISDGLINGDGIAPNPQGLFAGASAYADLNINGKVVAPTMFDALKAVINTQKCLGCRPNMILLSCSDYFLLQASAKDANGQYLIVPGFDAVNMTLDGCLIKQVNDTILPAGEFIVFDVNSLEVWLKGGIVFKEGYASVISGEELNGDWESNMTSFIIETRLFAWRKNDVCITKDTFDAVITYIAQP